MNEINAVQLIIRKFLFAIKDLRKEDSAAGRWLDWLGDTLQYQDLMENLEPFGAEMLAEAKTFSIKKRLGGQLKAAKGSLIKEGNSNPTQEEIEERRMEMYGDETITAAAITREGVDVVHDRENGKKGGRPRKSTADGDTREDSLNLRDTGDRGTMESGTSANNYDQETDISTNSPDASSGNAEGVNINGTPITRNGSRAACTSATSGQTISATEALEQPGEGGTPGIERESASLPSPTPVKTDPKPTRKAKAEVNPVEQKYPHGEFENIMLTTREYAQLCERLDNADSLIEEADGYFEAQPDKKRKYKSHYAMLLNWDRRRKEFEGVKPKKFKTAVDQDREEIKWLSDYYAKKERGENPPLPKIKMVGSA